MSIDVTGFIPVTAPREVRIRPIADITFRFSEVSATSLDMRKSIVAAVLVLVGLYAAASIGWARELGRTDPASAGYFRPLLFNFFAEYHTGAALGFKIGSTRSEVFRVIQASYFKIDPACWGDNRAGGASLYAPDALLAKARTQPDVCLDQPRATVILHFERDRLRSVEVSYIRTDIIT